MKAFFLDTKEIKRVALLTFLFGLVALMLTSVLIKPTGILPVQGKAHAICKVKTGKKVAALTFNINYGSRVAGPVLDGLKNQNVKATFFVTCAWVRKYPELARRITSEGHEIASSVDRQFNLETEPKEAVKEELAYSRDCIKEITGISPTLLRAPYGDWNDTVLAETARSGYALIRWSIDSLDIQTPGKNNIVNNVVKKIHPGAIILMNAGDTASQTPEALPVIIKELKNQGYEMVTVSSLLKMGPGVID